MCADVNALEVPRLDIGGPRRAGAARRRVEIDIEHAVRPCELKLGPFAFDDLQPRPAEMLDELAGGHAVDGAVIMLTRCHWRWRHRLWGWSSRRARGTGRDEQKGGEDQMTHGLIVAGAGYAGKLAGSLMRR